MKHKRKTNRPLGKSKKALRKEKALRVKVQKEELHARRILEGQQIHPLPLIAENQVAINH
jgi:hypothetical protein